MPRVCDLKFSANHFCQFFALDKLRDSQSPHGNDETRPQDSNLIIHPRRAIANLVWFRNPISSAGTFSRKTAADCREINLRSNCDLVHLAELFEPSKKCLAGSVCKRSLKNRLSRTGRLTNDNDIADNCTAGDRRRFHSWATTAFEQSRDVSSQLSLFGLVHHRTSHEGHGKD